jgi:hypothetical protein
METFQALGYQMTDIAVVSDELLAVWPEGEPLPLWHGLPTGAAGPLQLPATATPAEGAAPTATTLRDALAAIHSRYQIGPSRGCFDLLSPYPEYHRGLEEMTTLVLTDSRAAGLNDLDRQVLFHEVTGFDGARFFHAEGATATLVSLRTNRGYNLGCGSHYASPDALQVVDAEGHIYDVGSGGLLVQVWWVADRWVVLLRLKLDSTSGPTPWAIWHVGQGTAGWQRLVELEFTPTPYNFSLPPTLHFENGYQTLVADLDYWWADDPCPFTTDFTSLYKHDTWQMRRTYRLTDNTYTLISSEVLTFTAQRQDTGEAAPLNWQDYCGGPIQ